MKIKTPTMPCYTGKNIQVTCLHVCMNICSHVLWTLDNLFLFARPLCESPVVHGKKLRLILGQGFPPVTINFCRTHDIAAVGTSFTSLVMMLIFRLWL